MSEQRSQARVIQNGNPFADAVRLARPHTIRHVIDAGANVGDLVRHLRANFPEAEIHALEPDPTEFTRLAERYAQDHQVRCHQRGLGSSEQIVTLHRYTESGLNAVRPLSAHAQPYLAGYGTAPAGTVDIQLTTLDRFAQQLQLDTIDFLKLDLQGWEIECLRGAGELLAAGRIHAIYTEVNFVELYEQQIFYEDVALLLRDYGYRLFSLYALSLTQDGQLAWADALFVPRATTAARSRPRTDA